MELFAVFIIVKQVKLRFSLAFVALPFVTAFCRRFCDKASHLDRSCLVELSSASLYCHGQASSPR